MVVLDVFPEAVTVFALQLVSSLLECFKISCEVIRHVHPETSCWLPGHWVDILSQVTGTGVYGVSRPPVSEDDADFVVDVGAGRELRPVDPEDPQHANLRRPEL